MEIVLKACSLVVLVSVAIAPSAKERPQVEASKQKVDALLLALRSSGVAFQTPISFTPKNVGCTFTGGDCPADPAKDQVLVTPVPLFEKGGTTPVACAVAVGQVTITASPDAKNPKGETTVHWKLDLVNFPPPNGTDYEFEQKGGLVEFENNTPHAVKAAVSPSKKEMTAKIGYGRNKSVTYYPLVYQTTSNGRSLCGAFDPKIVNN